MANLASLYARPADLLQEAGTWSITAGAADSAYPLTNLYDAKAYTLCKSTGTTITFRITFGAAKTLEAIAFINTNATAIQVTNGAGLSQAVTIPSTPADGRRLDPWIDLRGLSNVSSTTWDIALTGASGVGLALPLLAQTVRTLPILWGMERTEAHPTIEHVTDYLVAHRYSLGIRARVYQGQVHRETARQDLETLTRGAKGAYTPFLFVPDTATNDAWCVHMTSDLSAAQQFTSIADAAFTFTEAQKGIL